MTAQTAGRLARLLSYFTCELIYGLFFSPSSQSPVQAQVCPLSAVFFLSKGIFDLCIFTQ